MKKILLSTIAVLTMVFATQAQNVYIPDIYFKGALVGNSAINTNLDSEIQVSEAHAYNGFLNLNSSYISDLTGIEEFINITGLHINNNQLTSLDLSNNTALTELRCQINQIASLNVSNNTALTELRCDNNQLTTLNVNNNINLTILSCGNNLLPSLNVNNNTALEELSFGSNQLTNINVSNNTALEILTCNNNQLTNIDVSNNPDLTQIICNHNQPLTSMNVANGNNTNLTNFAAHQNPNLTCIQVDDTLYSQSNWLLGGGFSFDNSYLFSENCAGTVLVSSITVQGQGGISTITIQGGTLQMEAAVLPANADDPTYTWSVTNGTGVATIDTNGLLTAITEGTVTVIATANDASGVTGIANITISNQTVGISELGVNKTINVYPNPTNSTLNIEVNETTNIKIVNLLGSTVATQKLNTGKNSIDMSGLTKGVYFLQTDKGGAIKFMKE